MARTRASVAYSNFVVEKAFSQNVAARPLAIPHPALALGAVLLVAATIGVLSLGGKAPRMAVPHGETPRSGANRAETNMPAIANTNLPDIQKREASLPAPIPSDFTYALAVDKSRKLLMVLKNDGEFYQIVRKYDISLGKIIGNKEREGDMRTPVGLYHIVEIKERKDLLPYYGPRAFVTDYPNRFDQANGRTGGGIWLHGSGQGARTADTHGCVVLDDDNVIKLANWVGINTPVAIFPDNFRLPIVSGRVEKRYFSPEFFYGEAGYINRG